MENRSHGKPFSWRTVFDSTRSGLNEQGAPSLINSVFEFYYCNFENESGVADP